MSAGAASARKWPQASVLLRPCEKSSNEVADYRPGLRKTRTARSVLSRARSSSVRALDSTARLTLAGVPEGTMWWPASDCACVCVRPKANTAAAATLAQADRTLCRAGFDATLSRLDRMLIARCNVRSHGCVKQLASRGLIGNIRLASNAASRPRLRFAWRN